MHVWKSECIVIHMCRETRMQSDIYVSNIYIYSVWPVTCNMYTEGVCTVTYRIRAYAQSRMNIQRHTCIIAYAE